MAFDFMISDSKTKSMPFTNGSSSHPVLKSSISTPMKSKLYDDTSSVNDTPRTFDSAMTITKGFIDSHRNQRSYQDDINSSLTNTSPLNTPKSGLSLGAKIQSKAKENAQEQPQQIKRRSSEVGLNPAPTSSPSTTTQYTNRTLYLRQQTAKAKRDSLEKRSIDLESADSSPSHQPKTTPQKLKPTPPSNGILKKTNSTANKSNNLATPRRTLGGSKASSRSNSRTSSPYGNSAQNNLMTASLNLPSGSALPGSNQNKTPLQRRITYDPIKAVEQDKLRKRQQKLLESSGNTASMLNASQENCSVNDNSNVYKNNYEDDFMSDSSYNSFSLPLQNLTSNSTNRQVFYFFFGIFLS